MMTTGLLYMPDGRTKVVRPANGEHWTRAELQDLMGGYTEVIRTVDGEFMVINEAMAVLDPPLEANYPATRLWVNGRKAVVFGNALVVATREELDRDGR
jgi:hypothetical protein